VRPLTLIIAALLSQEAAPPDRVHISFDNPVRVPGVQLDAGSSVFVPGRSVAGQVVIDIYRADDHAALDVIEACATGSSGSRRRFAR